MTDTAQIGNIFANISNNYFHLTVSEKKVADYVLSHKTDVQYMSISELAYESGVAEATISRFCRRLKLKGYNAFKLALAKATAEEHGGISPTMEGQEGEISPQDSISELCHKLYNAQTTAIAQSMELVRPERVATAVDMLCDAQRVCCMGQGGSMLIAAEAAHLFSTISSSFRPVSDSHMQAMAAAMMESNDSVLFYSYSGSTIAMLDTLKTIRERGAAVILVTRFPKSPGAVLANVVLQCGANENPLQSGSIPARIAQMYLTDILFSEYTRRDMNAAMESRNRIAQALAAKHV